MKISTLLFFSILLLSACRKGGDRFTISGRVYADCSRVPFANKELYFFQAWTGSLLSQRTGGELGTTVTGPDGSFSFTYTSINDEIIDIMESAGFGFNDIITSIPGNRDVSDMNVVYSPRTIIKVSLNVTKQYTTSDTLYVVDPNRPLVPIKIAGPFSNGHVCTIPNVSFEAGYKESRRAIGSYFNNINSLKQLYFPVVSCDTSRVVLNIN